MKAPSYILAAVLVGCGTAHAQQCDPMSITCLMQTPRESRISPLDLSPSAVDEYRRETERNQREWDQRRMQRDMDEQRSRLDALEEQRRDAEFRRLLRR